MCPKSASEPEPKDTIAWHRSPLLVPEKIMKPLTPFQAREIKIGDLPTDGSMPVWATRDEAALASGPDDGPVLGEQNGDEEEQEKEEDEQEVADHTSNQDTVKHAESIVPDRFQKLDAIGPNTGASAPADGSIKRRPQTALGELLGQTRGTDTGHGDAGVPSETSNPPSTVPDGTSVLPKAAEPNLPVAKSNVPGIVVLGNIELGLVGPKLIDVIRAHNKAILERIRKEEIGAGRLLSSGALKLSPSRIPLRALQKIWRESAVRIWDANVL